MRDRLLQLIAFLILAGFVGVLFWRVPRVDLGFLFFITLAAAGYDFFLYNRRRR
ncbi:MULTISPECIES: hypothetical protein [Rhizobium/Agrobacterium group]|jgi:hypothetical protein|uniref:Transmembrane protein n=2 Tax=Neorhizobium TaxID=1525371 RepID=A0ABV0LWR9_9HYPH|nr:MULTISPECIES: hypothetical protein [Rhizobium/Agrobacterium group]MCC2613400.1 hypothetical protein [Neorhizobium petrolearium]WGI68479.1 hypothetical protein QEO92_26620 [Neorhizobium petrolearium]